MHCEIIKEPENQKKEIDEGGGKIAMYASINEREEALGGAHLDKSPTGHQERL